MVLDDERLKTLYKILLTVSATPISNALSAMLLTVESETPIKVNLVVYDLVDPIHFLLTTLLTVTQLSIPVVSSAVVGALFYRFWK